MAGVNLTEAKKFEEELQRCMKCGYCTFWCPVYQEEPAENCVARGKHAIIKKLLAGEAPFSQEIYDLLGKCTLCMNCSTHCLFRVKTASVIVGTRADKANYAGVPFPYNWVFQHLLPRRILFGRVLRAASWVQGLFFPRTEGTIRHLPSFLAAFGKGRNIPSIAPRFLRQLLPSSVPASGGGKKIRAGFFAGCMMEFVYPDLGKKIVDFLSRHGVEIVFPRGQGCCGAPVYLGAGDFATGRKLADANLRAFSGLDYIITGCATCASSLKEYGKYLAQGEEEAGRYNDFGARVTDLSRFLVNVLQLPEKAYSPSGEARGLKITWHDPCHLVRYLGVKEEPRRIMQSIPGVEYTEMKRADWCCGMAGSFSLNYYDLSCKIADRKMDTIQETGADAVVTSCPGCMIQLTDNLLRRKMPQKVMHLIDLLE
jgi:glycolate oxidase iron-sulfur subunit